MGTDIHSMAEVYRPRYAGPGVPESWRWTLLDSEIFRSDWRGAALQSTPLDGRNYDLFALLADVRNGTGFAGVKRGDRIEPLSDPRGVPGDASFAWLAEVDSLDVDMHSHSYFTLAELIRFEAEGRLDQPMRRTGVISAEAYETIKRTGMKPTEWSGSISGYGICTLTVDEYEAGERGRITEEHHALAQHWLAMGTTTTAVLAERKPQTYIQYVWEDTLTESASALRDAISALTRYAADLSVDPDDPETPGWFGHGGISHDHLRIVFGFDN